MITTPPPEKLPVDVLGKIGERLELLDFLRFGGVCSSWRSSLVVETTDHNNETSSLHLQPKPQIPWLMLYSPDNNNKKKKNDDDNNNNNVYFFSLVESKAYKFQLPETMRGFSHCIGSSEGFLISVHGESGNLLAGNPLTGQQIQLPPTAGLLPYFETAPWNRFHKAIVCPSTQAVVVCYGANNGLAFTLPGQDSWTTFEIQMDGNDNGPTFQYGLFNDMIFHKGRLHAINFLGTLWVYDLLRCTTTGDIKPSLRTRVVGQLANKFTNSRRYLVVDPATDDLHLISRDLCYDPNPGPWSLFYRTATFKVFKLDPDTYDWEEIHSLGEDLSLFLGFNRSMTLSQRDFPCLQSNMIYFTDDIAVSELSFADATDGVVGDMGVFSLEDGSIGPLSISDDVLRCHNWPPPLWFSPTWKGYDSLVTSPNELDSRESSSFHFRSYSF